MKWFRNLLDLAFAWLVLLPGFWVIIQYSRLHEKVKELYYILFSIPYWKVPDKFYHYVVRKNK